MNSQVVMQALKALGEVLGKGKPVRFHIVGGAAGLVTGELPSHVTTADIDAIAFQPSVDVESILEASRKVSERYGLPSGWLSVDAGLFASSMPAGWEGRSRKIGEFGRLTVYAAGRLDLIAMKFYAHRDKDVEHLSVMKVREEERAFVRGYLTMLCEVASERGKAEMALHLLEAWNVAEH